VKDLRVEFHGEPNDRASVPYGPEDQVAIGKAFKAQTSKRDEER
jgi:hypothetical protein